MEGNDNRTQTINDNVDNLHMVKCTDNASFEEMEMFTFVSLIVEGIILVVINSGGVIANLIAIPVLVSKELTNRFNRILAVLAGFDATYNFLDILQSVRNQHYPYFNDNKCGPIPYHVFLHDYMYYRILYPLQHIVMMASIYTTVIVAFERYVAVSKPISAFMQDNIDGWRKVCAYIVPMSVFAVAFNLPTFYEFCGIEAEMRCPDDGPFYHPCMEPQNETFSPQQCNYFVYADLKINGKYSDLKFILKICFYECNFNFILII